MIQMDVEAHQKLIQEYPEKKYMKTICVFTGTYIRTEDNQRYWMIPEPEIAMLKAIDLTPVALIYDESTTTLMKFFAWCNGVLIPDYSNSNATNDTPMREHYFEAVKTVI